MTEPRVGVVSLVGAGPGDPDHLTLKAARCLREADLVLYDALVAPEVVALAARADHVFVGKRAGRAQTPQAAIHAAMIDAALNGRRVVRLKGGDPFVFGRGSEEALALQAAGVPYEIVPGVTTAVAAPGLAGIPLTHRAVAGGVVVLTGADQAAVLLGAATRDAWTWRGALNVLATMTIPADRDELPGTIVVGRVAGLPLTPRDADADDAFAFATSAAASAGGISPA